MTSVSRPTSGGKEVATVDHSGSQGAMVDLRTGCAGASAHPVWPLEVFGGLVAEEFHDIAAFDQSSSPSASQTLQFDRADLGTILVALAALLRLLIVVEFTFDPGSLARWKSIDGRPQQVLEVGFEAGFGSRLAVSASKMSATALVTVR